MIDAIYLFQEAIRSIGMQPPELNQPGKFYRFPGIGKHQSNRAGWCIFFNDGLGGCYGDWSSDFSETWQAKRDKSFSQAERMAFRLQVENARAQADADRNAIQAEAAKKAAIILKSAPPASCDHAYLIRKHIKAHGAKVYKGSLVLPVIDFDDNLHGLQFISANGGKLLLSGSRKRSCFILVAGNMTVVLRVIICEGWATGCSLAEDEPTSLVLAAIDAGNLELVSIMARRRWPSAELIIAGDDDRLTPNNPGATKARAAAFLSNALLALPQWPEEAPDNLTDFNDLAVWLVGGVA